MDLENFYTLVLILANGVLLIHAWRMEKKFTQSNKHIKHLKRTIEKLNSKNGQLWYEIAKNKIKESESIEDNTAFTVTRR